MKIIYMGTSEFAVPSLEALAERHEVAAVVTQPDRPKGRSAKPAPSPVKEAAQRLGIEVLQPESAKKKEFSECLEQYGAEMFVVASYGQILPKRLLDIPKYGSLNVHASLLPRHRGASPIQTAIICGDETSGVTIMKMDRGVDTGDIFLKREVPIDEADTAQTLHDKLALIGAEALIETISLIENGEIEPRPQNNEEATHAGLLTKEMGLVDWSKTPRQIADLVRGLDPWPGAWTTLSGEVLKIWKAAKVDFEISNNSVEGEIISVEKGVIVKVGNGAVRLLEIQSPGSKRMADIDYLKGRSIDVGMILGDERL